MEKKKLPEEQEPNIAKKLYFTKLSFLKLKKRISPLCALIVYCHTQLSEHCLKVFKVTQTDINDDFLFSSVCCNGSLDLFDFLLKNTSTEYLTEQWENFSPIHIASMFHNFEILDELIRLGFNVNLLTAQMNLTPLLLAAGNNSTTNYETEDQSSSKARRNKTVQILLSNGADINLCTESGVSPLYIACYNGHKSTVRLLLSNAAEIDLCDDNGANPFHIACQNGHYIIAHLLLSKGANINSCMKNGASPLYI